jgi:RNA polymerase-binding transcription factor
MSDSTTAATAADATTVASSVADRAAQTLREHAARSERQLHELESDLVGLLSDHGTIQEDRDGARRLIESIRADLNRTKRALARVEAGTYGLCTTCREPIAEARLAAIPESEHCNNCA